MYIAVKSPEFGEVYRAKTLNNDRDNPLVTYVDYGNEVGFCELGIVLVKEDLAINIILACLVFRFLDF